AVDAALASQSFALDRQQQLDLEQSFSRGFSHGFLGGINHQVLVPGRFPKSRGVRLGRVIDKTPRGVVVELDAGHSELSATVVQPGDGIVFDEGHPEQDEQGGRVVEVRPLTAANTPLGRTAPKDLSVREKGLNVRAHRLELVLYHGSVNLAAIATGS